MKKLIRICSVFIAMVIVVLASLQMGRDEAKYPLDAKYSAQVSFAQSKNAKREIVDSLDEAASKNNATFILSKADQNDSINGMKVFEFGEKAKGLPAEGKTLSWFAKDRYGSAYAAQNLGKYDVSGTYSFYSQEDCKTFTKKAGEMSAVFAEACAARPSSFVLGAFERDEAGVACFVTLLAVLFLSLVLLWTWTSGRGRSQSIRLMNGFSVSKISRQDFIDLCFVAGPFLIGGFAASFIVSAAVCKCASVPLLFKLFLLSFGTCAVLTLISLAFTCVFDAILHPRVSQLGSRKTNIRFARLGTAFMRAVCILTAVAFIPVSYAMYVDAQYQADSASLWRNAKKALAVKIGTPEEDTDWVKAHKQEFEKFFKLAGRNNSMHVSALVSSALCHNAPADGGDFSAQFEKETGGRFDGFVITDRGFLDLLHVDDSYLVKEETQELSSQLAENIKGYEELWRADDSDFSFTNNVYSWNSDGKIDFPALECMGDSPGSVVNVKKPLILLVDNVSSLNAMHILTSFMTTSNVMFADEDVLEDALNESGIFALVLSKSTVADSALTRAKELEMLSRSFAVSVGIMLLVVALCIVQTAKIWAIERKRKIFVLRTAGKSWAEIQKWRFAVCAALALLVVFAGLTNSLGLVASPLVLAAFWLLFAGAYMTFEVVCGCKACRDVFVAAVRRQ